MREAQEIEIGEHTYVVGHLPPTKALQLFTDLTKWLGPSFGRALGGATSLQDLMAQNVGDGFGNAVEAFCRELEFARLDSVIKRLASVTSVKGVGPLERIYEAHFAMTGLSPLIKLVPFALKVQFGDFFTGLSSASSPLLSSQKQSD